MSFSDGRMIRVDQVAAMLKSTEAILGEAKTTSDNLRSRLKIVENYYKVEQSAFSSVECAHEVYSKIPFIEEELIGALRIAAGKLYSLGAIYPEVFAFEDDPFCADKHYQKILTPENQVLAFLEPSSMFIRTPMLWNRQNMRVRGKDGRTIGAERSKNYCDAVNYAIRLADNFFDYDFAQFQKKIIHYLFVYADFPANKIYIVDNDNHITKYITDAIVTFLPNGDHPLSCNMYFSAEQSKCIPEGTYITVTKGENGLIPQSEIVNFWHSKYEIME